MTDFKQAKQALVTAIGIWRRVWEVSSIAEPGTDTPVARTWQAVEDAILALDNAAYARAEEKFRGDVAVLDREIGSLHQERGDLTRYAADWHQTATARGAEIERLKAAFPETQLQLGMDLVNANTEVLRLKQELERAERQRDRLAAQVATLTRHPKPPLSTLGSRMWAQLEKERDQARQERDQAQAEVKHVRALLADAQSDVRILDREHDDAKDRGIQLRDALRTLADRYHHELCRCCSGAKSRADCDARDGVVRKAEEALGSDLKFFETDDEQLNEAERQRGVRVSQPSPRAVVLQGALATLADRYHAQMCYANRRQPHARKDCARVLAVQQANAVLAGESGAHRVSSDLGDAWQLIELDHPQGAPPMWGGFPPPKPRSPTEWPYTSAITKIDVLRACRGFHERGDGTPFVTLAGDFSEMAITLQMRAMVAAGLLMYDTNLSTAWATPEGRHLLEAADRAEQAEAAVRGFWQTW